MYPIFVVGSRCVYLPWYFSYELQIRFSSIYLLSRVTSCLLPTARDVHPIKNWTRIGPYRAITKIGLRCSRSVGNKCSWSKTIFWTQLFVWKTLVPDFSWKCYCKAIFWLLAYIFTLCGAPLYYISWLHNVAFADIWVSAFVVEFNRLVILGVLHYSLR
jgi:hypothetical protein